MIRRKVSSGRSEAMQSTYQVDHAKRFRPPGQGEGQVCYLANQVPGMK